MTKTITITREEFERRERRRESSLRKKLDRRGHKLHKSRAAISADNFGGYQIIEMYAGYVVDGTRFELSLDDVEEWLSDYDREESE